MKNVKIIIEFDGTDYKGWQVQPNDPSIQQEIEQRLMIVTKEFVRIHASGRTDAGVHAERMTANFEIEKETDLSRLKKSLNALLPDDITIIEMAEAPVGFHARKSAKQKIYEYRIFNRKDRSPFLRRYAWHIRKPLDIYSMKKAARFLIGEYDFTGFASVGSEVRTKVRTIYDIKIEKEGSDVTLTFVGSGFLKQMVRNIVGLLVQVGHGKFTAEFAEVVLVAKQIQKEYITAPPEGLFLKDVIY